MSGYKNTILRIVRDDGQEMTFNGYWSGGWAIRQDGLDDFLDLPLTVDTSPNVLTDGSLLISHRVNECERTAQLVYAGAGDPKDVRGQALSFFNPKHSFSAYVTHLGRTRWCEGVLSAIDVPLKKAGYPCTVAFTLLCPDPYMRSTSHNEAAFGDARPMFGWPFVSHTRMALPDGTKYPVGFLFSETIYDGLNTVYNNGDVPTYYQVVIEAEAQLVNPTINKDGKFVKYLGTMSAGETLTIDFEASPPTVDLDGQNAITSVSRDSSFTDMEMQVGANIFNFTCDNMENRSLAKVQVLFWRKYLGV